MTNDMLFCILLSRDWLNYKLWKNPHSNCLVHATNKWWRPITFVLNYYQCPNYFPGSTPGRKHDSFNQWCKTASRNFPSDSGKWSQKNLDANSAKFSKTLLTVMNVLPDKSYSIKTSIKMIIVTKNPCCRNLELWSARLWCKQDHPWRKMAYRVHCFLKQKGP